MSPETLAEIKTETTLSLEPLRKMAVDVIQEAELEKRKTVAQDLGILEIPYDWGISGAKIVNVYTAMEKFKKLNLLRQTNSLPGKEGRELTPTLEQLTFSLLVEILREHAVWGPREDVEFDQEKHNALLESTKNLVCKPKNFQDPKGLFQKDSLPPLLDFLKDSAITLQYPEWRVIATDVSIACAVLCPDDRLSQSETKQKINSIISTLSEEHKTDYSSAMRLLPEIIRLYPDERSTQLINRLTHRVHALGPMMLRVGRDPQATLAFLVSSTYGNEAHFKLITNGTMSALSDSEKKSILHSFRKGVLTDVGDECIPHVFLAMCQMSDDSEQAQKVIKIMLERLLAYNKLSAHIISAENFRDSWARFHPNDPRISADEEASFILANLHNPEVLEYVKANTLTKILSQQMH